MKANNPSVPAKIEIIFDICYLTFALCAGVYYLINQHSTAALLYGIMTLCLVGGDAFRSDGAFSFMWLAILISFGCYLPVTLFAQKYPKLGMLMLPKTCAYIWIVCMGFSLL